MSSLTAVIFDCYETLFPNSPHQWMETFEEICRDQKLRVEGGVLWREWRARDVQFRQTRVNLEAPEQSPPFKSYYQAWRESFQETFQAMGLKGEPEAAAARCVEAMGCRHPFDDTLSTLERLRGRWRLGILSNADDAYLNPLLSRYPLPVDAVLSSERARAYKPHPLPFQLVLTLVGAEPEETICVGDSPLDDIYGAQRLGMKTVWINRKGVPWSDDIRPPDHRIQSLLEIPDILENY